MTNNPLCPCGSDTPYSQCCEPIIKGSLLAQTPEALMRARYSAFTQGEIEFVEKTNRGKAQKAFDAEAARQWSAEATWHGLHILATSPIDEKSDLGYVEFVADCEEQGQRYHAHERSRFEKIEGQWFYTDGRSLNQTPENQTQNNQTSEHHHHHDGSCCDHDHHPKTMPAKSNKIGRNELCPCGSGKKYKKCCA